MLVNKSNVNKTQSSMGLNVSVQPLSTENRRLRNVRPVWHHVSDVMHRILASSANRDSF